MLPLLYSSPPDQQSEYTPCAPPAPLSADQQLLAKSNIRAYLTDSYAALLPFNFYTFRSVKETHVVDRPSVLDGLASRAPLHPNAAIRPLHSLSDPTATVAILLAEGIEADVPERFPVPAAQIRLLLDALPTHLSKIIDVVLVHGTKLSQAATQLNTSTSSVSRRVDEAVTVLCSFLYSSRWPALPAPYAALARLQESSGH